MPETNFPSVSIPDGFSYAGPIRGAFPFKWSFNKRICCLGFDTGASGKGGKRFPG